MVAGGVTGGTYLADYLSLDNGVAHRYQSRRHVAVHRPRTVGVGDGDIVPIGGPVGGYYHRAALRRQDIRPMGCREIYAAV